MSKYELFSGFLDSITELIINSDFESLFDHLEGLNIFLVNLADLLGSSFAQPEENVKYEEEFLLNEPLSYIFFKNFVNIKLVPKNNNSLVEETPKDNQDKSLKIAYNKDFKISQEEYEQVIKGGKPYVCPRCDKKCTIKRTLHRHLLKMCKGVKIIWPNWKTKNGIIKCMLDPCINDNVTFKKHEMAWSHHYDLHAPEAKMSLKCPTCDKAFTYKKMLNRHIKDVHGTSQAFMCKYCGKCYKNKKRLTEHERNHTGEKPEECPHCEYKSISKFLVKRHIASRHDSTTREVCDLCGKSFNTKDKLKRHMTTHEDISEKCELCNKMTRDLRRHMFKAHKLVYPCPECKQEFSGQFGVDMHRQKVHGIIGILMNK